MANSTLNPISPTPDPQPNPKTTPPTSPLKRYARHVPPPPDATSPADAQACEVLISGDDTSRFFGIHTAAQRAASNPAAFLAVFAEFLASEAMAFDRYTRNRAVAVNIQISDDYQAVSDEFQDIDDNARQYLAQHKLFSNAAFRAFISDLDRAFRRTNQSHRAILQAARLANR